MQPIFTLVSLLAGPPCGHTLCYWGCNIEYVSENAVIVMTVMCNNEIGLILFKQCFIACLRFIIHHRVMVNSHRTAWFQFYGHVNLI